MLQPSMKVGKKGLGGLVIAAPMNTHKDRKVPSVELAHGIRNPRNISPRRGPERAPRPAVTALKMPPRGWAEKASPTVGFYSLGREGHPIEDTNNTGYKGHRLVTGAALRNFNASRLDEALE